MPALNPSAALIPPWPTGELWREANAAVAILLKQSAETIGVAKRLSHRIRDGIHALDGPMAALCAATCPACQDPCCRRATVWFDFIDLIHLHLSGEAIPPAQINPADGVACRYLAREGCTLPRGRRPFICTWYVCPEQTHLLRRQPGMDGGMVLRNLAAIKAYRGKMEGLVIGSVG
jgi:hypothetical protein